MVPDFTEAVVRASIALKILSLIPGTTPRVGDVFEFRYFKLAKTGSARLASLKVG